MKRKLLMVVLMSALLTSNAFAAQLETRTYDEGGENNLYLPISISNVAWDSIEKIPSDIKKYCEWCGYDINDSENLPIWVKNRIATRTIDRMQETTATDYIYIGTASPCMVDMSDGGVPHISKLTPIGEGDSLIGTVKVGNEHYKTEEIQVKDVTFLSEGMYLLNNYTNDTYELMNSFGAGSMYWYDFILNVQNAETITNADAYVKKINKFGEIEAKSLIAFKNQVPVIKNDRTLVPMRDIFEALSCTVNWDGDTKTVVATSSDGIEITLTIGNNIMKKNGEEIELEVAPQIINESTMIPVRAVSEALNLTVEWDGDEKLISIIKDETM